MENLWQNIGAIAGAAMPIFNVPMIIKIIQRKSSADISLVWCIGIWGCIILMVPSALMTDNITLKAFGISNFIFFSAVVYCVFKYRK